MPAIERTSAMQGAHQLAPNSNSVNRSGDACALAGQGGKIHDRATVAMGSLRMAA